MGHYSIKDLEHLTGIKAHTIRIWEKRYGLIHPARTKTNIRTYSDEDLRRLLNISILNRHGMKISHLAKMTDAEVQDKVLFISQDPNDRETQIESLLMAMIKLDEPRFHDVFNKLVMVNGFEEVFSGIVMKALEQVGLLWQAGTINPAQEHFISNLVRQKLVSAIDGLHPSKPEHRKRFMLFLPEGELHELGLLFSAYLIKKRGHDLLYFGQFTPLTSVIEAEAVWPADILLVSVTTTMTEMNPDTFIEDIHRAFPDRTILITGRQANQLSIGAYASIHPLEKPEDLVYFLDALE